MGCGKIARGSDDDGGSTSPPERTAYNLRIIETVLFFTPPPLDIMPYGKLTITDSNGDIISPSKEIDRANGISSTKDKLYVIPAGETVSFNYYNNSNSTSEVDYYVSCNIVGDPWHRSAVGYASYFTAEDSFEMDCDVLISINISARD